MKKQIEIFMFIDALGWKIVQEHHFLTPLLPCRQQVAMQFGYSCSAVPTILSGRSPQEHGHLSLFYRDPEHSPFKWFRFLKIGRAPNSLFNRGRVRHWLSRIVKKCQGYTGYFQLYSVPFERLPHFNYCEKYDIFAPGGLAPFDNLRDVLDQSGLRFHITDWHKSEQEAVAAALQAMRDDCDFIFLYTANLDGLLHQRVEDFDAVERKLQDYTAQIESFFAAAAAENAELHFTVISDHGMTPLAGTVDLKEQVEATGLHFGSDYTACYDSTMARFWYHTPAARDAIEKLLADNPAGHWLTEADQKHYGIFFADRKYGEGIYLLNPGWQIVPSDMCLKPLPGMHGFAPEDEDSAAVLLSNVPPSEYPVAEVKDFFHLMVRRIRQRVEAKRHGQG